MKDRQAINLLRDFLDASKYRKILEINHCKADQIRIDPEVDLIIIHDDLSSIDYYFSFLKSLSMKIKKNTKVILYIPDETLQMQRSSQSKSLFYLRSGLVQLTQSNWIYRRLFEKSKSIIYLPELIGRLFYLGYSIEKEVKRGKYTFVECKKILDKNNFDDEKNYGLFLWLNRLGKNDKEIAVPKLRTMFPYSEYCHQYYIDKKGIGRIGKVKDDPRITRLGKVLRKYYLDEIPQLFLVMTGTLNLVGLRPISKVFLKKYPADIIEKRKKFKPGVLPVTATDRINSLDDIFEREREYIKYRSDEGQMTDLKYLIKIVAYIFRGNRSN